MQEVYQQRIDQLQSRMSDADAGLTVLFPGPNMTYFSGVETEPSERHFLLLVPSNDDPVFMAPELVREEVRESGFDVSFWQDSDNPKDVLSTVLDEIGVPSERILLDDRMWVKFSQDIRELTDAEYGLASEVVKDMRIVKDEGEIENIREASQIVDQVVEDVREMSVVGMTENELRDFIKDKMDEYGGEGQSFPTVVAAGPNGAKPHHRGAEHEIRSGEPVVLDFGCWKDNYPSDQTRTLVFGEDEPSDKFKEVFDVVREAQQKAIEAVEPGVKAGKVDRAAREVIDEAGYGKDFIHRTGHGVGVEIHEHPEIKRNGEQVLEEGMVFSVEPGIYLEDELGVRIEDLVVVTGDGCERLNKTDRLW